MRTLMLKDVDEELARALERRGRARGNSIEQEAAAVIREAVGSIALTPAERAGRARAIIALTPRPQTTDSLELLRAERAL